MKKLLSKILLLAMVIGMFGLFGCAQKKQFNINTYLDKPQNTMLVDYFERTVGTPEEQPYYELVLYTYSDTQALLEQYIDGGTAYERCTSYLVPLSAVEDAFNVIQKNGMASWNYRLDLLSITGKTYVCKFPDGSDGYTRVTSERMPYNGTEAFHQVEQAISAYLKEEYKQ